MEVSQNTLPNFSEKELVIGMVFPDERFNIMLLKTIILIALWSGLPLVAQSAQQLSVQLQTNDSISAYEQDGGNVWSYDYGTNQVAIEAFEKYFILLQEGQLNSEEVAQAKYEAFKGNLCKFWTGHWLVATISQFDSSKATAAPKPHIAYPPQTGWSLQLPILEPIPFLVSNIVFKVPVIFSQNGQDLAVELSKNVSLQWLADGKVLNTRSVHPMFLSKGKESSPLMKIFTIPDQQFEIAKEANYTVRLLGTLRSPLVNPEEQFAPLVPFEITAAVMKYNTCSSAQLAGEW